MRWGVGMGRFPRSNRSPLGVLLLLCGLVPTVSEDHRCERKTKILHEGKKREFHVVLPSRLCTKGSADDKEIITPVLFAAHGFTSKPEKQLKIFSRWTKEYGMILIAPEGYKRSWNGGACCGKAREEELDDFAFFRRIIDYIRKDLKLAIHPKLIFGTGSSNGGFLIAQDARQEFPIFSAVAPIVGLQFGEDPNEAAVPFFAQMSKDDPVVAYKGCCEGFKSDFGQKDVCCCGIVVPNSSNCTGAFEVFRRKLAINKCTDGYKIRGYDEHKSSARTCYIGDGCEHHTEMCAWETAGHHGWMFPAEDTIRFFASQACKISSTLNGGQDSCECSKGEYCLGTLNDENMKALTNNTETRGIHSTHEVIMHGTFEDDTLMEKDAEESIVTHIFFGGIASLALLWMYRRRKRVHRFVVESAQSVVKNKKIRRMIPKEIRKRFTPHKQNSDEVDENYESDDSDDGIDNDKRRRDSGWMQINEKIVPDYRKNMGFENWTNRWVIEWATEAGLPETAREAIESQSMDGFLLGNFCSSETEMLKAGLKRPDRDALRDAVESMVALSKKYQERHRTQKNVEATKGDTTDGGKANLEILDKKWKTLNSELYKNIGFLMVPDKELKSALLKEGKEIVNKSRVVLSSTQQ